MKFMNSFLEASNYPYMIIKMMQTQRSMIDDRILLRGRNRHQPNPNPIQYISSRQAKIPSHISRKTTPTTRKNTCRAKQTTNNQTLAQRRTTSPQIQITSLRRPHHGRRQARLPPRHRSHPRIHRRHLQPAQQQRNRKPHRRLYADHRTLATEFRALRCAVPASFCESGKADDAERGAAGCKLDVFVVWTFGD